MTSYLFSTIVQKCGHTMKVLRMYELLGIRGLCQECWVIVREVREEVERKRYAQQKPEIVGIRQTS